MKSDAPTPDNPTQKTEKRPGSSLKKNLLLLAGSLLLILILSEIAIRLMDLAALRSLTLPVDDERFWENVWLTSASQREIIPLPQFQYDPNLGWTPKPGWHSPEVTFNSAGIRSASEFSINKPESVTRIGLFGDSFTFGEEVSNEETFAAHLQQSFPSAEILNFGVPGYGTDQMLLRYESLGMKYQLDWVLVMLFLPDIHRDVLAFRDYKKPRFQMRNNELVLTGVPVPDRNETIHLLYSRPPRQYFPLWYECYLYKFVRTRLKSRFSQIGNSDYDLPLTESILDRFKKKAESQGSEFMLILAPREEDVSDPKGGLYRKVEKKLIRWAKDRNIPVLNLREPLAEAMAASKEPLWNGHWTPAGHRKVAELILKELQKQNPTDMFDRTD